MDYESKPSDYQTKPQDRPLSRRGFLKSLVLGSTALTLAGCAVKECDIDDLVKNLGPKWSNLTEDKRKQFKQVWNELKQEERQFLCDTYHNPKATYQNLSELKKKFIDDYTDSSLTKKQKENIQKTFPWINVNINVNNDTNLGDRIIIEYAQLAGFRGH
jgi:hypothetical protein